MNMKFCNSVLREMKILNVLVMTIIFANGWIGYYAWHTSSTYYFKGSILIIVLYMILYIIYSQVYDALLVSFHRVSELVYSQCLSAILSDAIMFLVIWLLTKSFPAVLPMLLVFVVQFFFAWLWSFVANYWYFKSFPAKKTAIVYYTHEGIEDMMEDYGLDAKYDVQVIESTKECMEGGLKSLEQMEVVFLCGVHSQPRNVILKHCIAKGIAVYVIPRIGDVIMSGAHQMHMLHLPILQIKRYNPPLEFLFLKRTFDIVASLLGLIIASPVLLITALAIKSDGGPVFYKQCRLTKDGREFQVLKFRSMDVNAEQDGVARLSSGAMDKRITKVGQVIRKTRIDELPQLFNVLRGEMSLVGPRPERPEIAKQYEEILPEFALRLQAKAGLTGYAQVYGKYNSTPDDKLRMDLMYIANPSLLEDLRIIFATIKILFLSESTEGIAEGQTTAALDRGGDSCE